MMKKSKMKYNLRKTRYNKNYFTGEKRSSYRRYFSKRLNLKSTSFRKKEKKIIKECLRILSKNFEELKIVRTKSKNFEKELKIVRTKSKNFEEKNKLRCMCENKKCEKIIVWYVLQLESGKIYVGVTERDILIRYAEHVNGKGKGSSWTKKYRPLKILASGEFCHRNKLLENEKTLEMMNEHGIENVRGGKWTTVNLTSFDINKINVDLDHMYDRCYKCHKSDHYSSDCLGLQKAVHINVNIPEWRRKS
jgi:predicted GIY-YIG superfamily endonuclease